MIGIFFIVGTGRCGTNLCQRMLDLHPELKVVTETHFIPTLIRLYAGRSISWEEFVQTIEEHYVSDGKQRWIDKHLEAAGRNCESFRSDFEEFCFSKDLEAVEDFVEAFFEFCYGEGVYLLGDKTPQYGLHMKDLVELWPHAKFIHMVRDGRYAATSMRKHPGLVRLINAGFPEETDIYSYRAAQTEFSTEPVQLVDCIRWWSRIANAVRREAEGLPDCAYLEVRYESLLLKPISELVRMARFLDVPINLKWLLRSISIPRPFSLWRQRGRLSREEYCLLTSVASSTLETFGYSTRSFWLHKSKRVADSVRELVNWVVAQGLVSCLIGARSAMSNEN